MEDRIEEEADQQDCMMNAVFDSNVARMKDCHKRGADAAWLYEDGMTLMYLSCQEGALGCALWLYQHGAAHHVNQTIGNWLHTPMQAAIRLSLIHI